MAVEVIATVVLIAAVVVTSVACVEHSSARRDENNKEYKARVTNTDGDGRRSTTEHDRRACLLDCGLVAYSIGRTIWRTSNSWNLERISYR